MQYSFQRKLLDRSIYLALYSALILRPAVDIQQLVLMSSCMVASKPVNFCLLRGRNQANFSLLNENIVRLVTGE